MPHPVQIYTQYFLSMDILLLPHQGLNRFQRHTGCILVAGVHIGRFVGNAGGEHAALVELVKGKRKTSSRKFYPGYILVRMKLDDETWHVVNDTAKVTGFLGGRNNPTAISDEEADQILNRMEAGKLKPQPKYFFESGDEIRVVDGPFTNFNGTVEEVNPEKGKIKVLVSIFGRSTPVELEFVQVVKI